MDRVELSVDAGSMHAPSRQRPHDRAQRGDFLSTINRVYPTSLYTLASPVTRGDYSCFMFNRRVAFIANDSVKTLDFNFYLARDDGRDGVTTDLRKEACMVDVGTS